LAKSLLSNTSLAELMHII